MSRIAYRSRVRFASINLNKGLNTPQRRQDFERWLDVWSPDVLLVQEPCAAGRPPTTLGDHTLLGGNLRVAIYALRSLHLDVPQEHDPSIQELRVDGTRVFNAYFPHEGRGERATLFRKLRELTAPHRTLVFGDFNMAPRPEDGRYGDDEAKKWTGVDERRALHELLDGRGMVDVFVERAPAVEPYTFEKLNRGKWSRFRCDFVLATRDLSSPTETALYIAHDTRRGAQSFTDHSAIVLELGSHDGQPTRHAALATRGPSPAVAPTPWQRRAKISFVDDPKSLSAAVRTLMGTKVVGLDVETEVYKKRPRLCLVQLAAGAEVLVIDALGIPDLELLKPILEDAAITKVIHHASAERTALSRVGLRIINVDDTEKRSRRLHGGRAGHTLAEVCARELGVTLDKSQQRSDWSARPLTHSQLEYAAADAEVLLALHAAFEAGDPSGPEPLLFAL